MKIALAFKGVQSLCLDTAPLIYYTEQHPNYFDLMKAIFQHIQQEKITLFTSTLTLTEVLMKPIQAQNQNLQNQNRNLLLNTQNFSTVNINNQIAIQAAELRAKHNLRTPDAFQVATGIHLACDAFSPMTKGSSELQKSQFCYWMI
jgi:predicted nucleic acid-binding protein